MLYAQPSSFLAVISGKDITSARTRTHFTTAFRSIFLSGLSQVSGQFFWKMVFFD